MTPTKHPLCNDILRAPIGSDDVADLHIRREDSAVWSFWKPTPEELAALVMGGTVALHVASSTHPPLSIHATTPTEERTTAIPIEESAAISDAIRGRHAALISLTKRIVAEWVRTSIDSQDRRRLVDEFLDLVTMNHAPGEIVRSVPVDQPAEPAVTQADVDRYRADAEGWKQEAERYRAEVMILEAVVDRVKEAVNPNPAA